MVKPMKKYFDTFLKVMLSAILLAPIAGTLGLFPPPTADLYNTPEAYEFIAMLTAGRYVTYIMAGVFAVCLVLMWTNRMALAALLILPFTVNVVGFHAFLDGGLLTAGAVLGNIMLILNLYFLWQHRGRYRSLVHKDGETIRAVTA
jgi:glycerol-3-phosphate acyltransferase PlsY